MFSKSIDEYYMEAMIGEATVVSKYLPVKIIATKNMKIWCFPG
jgi:hypothetical protein